MKTQVNHGNIDLSFGDEGYVITDSDKAAGAVCSLATGAIRNFYLDHRLTVSGFYIQGRLANGQVDSQFGEAGTRFLKIVRPVEENVRYVKPLYAMRTAADDCLVIGVLIAGMTARAFVSKVHANGEPDLAYGQAGTATFTLVEASSGKLQVDTSKAVSKLYAAATERVGTRPRLGSVSNFREVATGQVAQDGSLVFSIRDGFFSSYGDFIVKVNARGELEETFQGGYVQVGESGRLARIGSVIFDEQQRIVACGEIANYSFVVRLTAQGAADTSFGAQGSGFCIFAGEQPDHRIRLHSLLSSNTGRLLVGGHMDTYPAFFGSLLIGLEEDGHLDPGFAEGGLLGVRRGDGFYFLCSGLQGSVLATCRDLGWDGTTIGYVTELWCITAQGNIDPAFGNGSSHGFAGSQRTALNHIQEVHAQADGKVLLYAFHGGFTEEPLSTRFCRVLPDTPGHVRAASSRVTLYSR
ncbi:hypothetical protein [Pseudomonas rubra]|uniref:Delta-60 repeat domain-containing protein n=1 Tax=Pseudomonas rubra TaxID=2942627 RepID=A0ABT5PAY6_9PSED|nr:hypothetical protein [Pseudomonas rubra]MDD1015332.1 hypothetical protein [Pseudomonas rubra]MDD1039554.1 hypothetical protein [Pseudomonas rubra]MDD1154020.1 hypothetical protein [Pseudomonas rubra]